MAKTKSTGVSWRPESRKKVTSIGSSNFTRFNSKNDKKLGKKVYRGQGR